MHRLRPVRGLRTDRSAQVIIAIHAFTQNLRRAHYELATDLPVADRAPAVFTKLPRRSDRNRGPVHPRARRALNATAPASDATIAGYLRARGVAEEHRPALVRQAGGNWLHAYLLADRALRPGFDPAALPEDRKSVV